MSDRPENAPEACPGTESEQAGRASACAGCPNQSACQSAPRGPDPDVELIEERMQSIQHKVLVLSGKGGVGKSTVATQLALALAARGKMVGLLDIDICGPSIPHMLGVGGETIHQSNTGWQPVSVEDNLCVMSIAFLLENQGDAVIWRGPKKNGLIKQFLRDVDWGELDYLIVDTPPGTSDEHLSITQYLKSCNPDGAVVVTTPQEVALADVRKEINFCAKVQLPVLGVVENMSGFVCPKCSTETQIFAPSTGGARAMCTTMQVPFLGALPIDPKLARACDEGTRYQLENPTGPVCVALNAVVDQLLTRTESATSAAQPSS